MEYSEKVIDHFVNPRNTGKLVDANATFTAGSAACGDQVSFFLKVNPATLIIEDIKFLSYGCASNIATASMTTEIVKGMTITEAKQMTWKTIVEKLDGLPDVKIHCSILAVETLQGAIANYEQSV
jgi:nitrogen fixation NifU-like protein